MSRVVKTPVSSYSPFYGCGIVAAAALIFGGIIAWSVYTLFRQNAEIEKFSVATPAELPPVRLSAEDEAALAAKWAALKQAIAEGKAGSMELSLAELNAVVARAPDLGHGTYADIVRFTGANPEKNLLLADISLPLNALPFSGKPKRYLAGHASFQVEVVENGPDARIIHLEVPGKEVPAGFVQSQEFWTWVAPYHKDAELAGVLKALRSAQVTSGGLRLSTQAP